MKLPPLVVRAQAEATRIGFEKYPALPDPRRDAWLEHPAFSSTELWVTRERAVIAVRRG